MEFGEAVVVCAAAVPARTALTMVQAVKAIRCRRKFIALFFTYNPSSVDLKHPKLPR
jgi:hypothetical protein